MAFNRIPPAPPQLSKLPRDYGRTISPVATFAALSLLFGTIILFVTPPLRGPDETANFLRAYGVAQGDLVASQQDTSGRKGIFVPARLHDGFYFFESVRVKEKDRAFAYGPVFRTYFAREQISDASERPPTFVVYGGSEGYSPIAYLPQAAAALVARVLDLDFLSTLYLMRFAGLAGLTALIAYAISTVPNLAWSFLAISMLPAALYGRSVINADGSALAGAMVVIALWVRISISQQLSRMNLQSFWMALCALTKPPNLAFILLFPPSTKRPPWHLLAARSVPAMILAVLWAVSSGAETAAWRMVEITGQNLDAFDPGSKLGYLSNHPMHLLAAFAGALPETNFVELWRQVIGVFGLFDTVLQSWVYLTLSVLLFSTFLTRLPVAPIIRYRIALLSSVTILAYVAVVYLISYLVFTPLNVNSVWGVQGRYFVPVLPLLALCLAALVNRNLPKPIAGAFAMSAAVLSGAASVEAILRADWKL
jgi:uncharacterized membrane protein